MHLINKWPLLMCLFLLTLSSLCTDCDPMDRKWLKLSLYVLKAAITVAILYIIFSRFDLRNVFYSIMGLPLWVVLFMIFSTIFKHFTQYKNWKYSLQMNPGYKNVRAEVLSSYLIGIPLRFLIPGGTATYGKMFFVRNTSKLASIASVTSEKFFMTWTTWTFAAWAALFYFTHIPLSIRLFISIACSVFPFVVYYCLSCFKKTSSYRASYAQKAPRIVCLQFLYVFTTLIQLWVILNCFTQVAFFDALVRVALTNFANSIPITVSGLGLREYFAIHFFKSAGVTAEHAVTATLTLFLFHDLIPALIGSIILLKTEKV